MRNMTNFDVFKALQPEQLAYILYKCGGDRNIVTEALKNAGEFDAWRLTNTMAATGIERMLLSETTDDIERHYESYKDTLLVDFDRKQLLDLLTDYIAYALEMDRRDVHVNIHWGSQTVWYASLMYFSDNDALAALYDKLGCDQPDVPGRLTKQLCEKIVTLAAMKGAKLA